MQLFTELTPPTAVTHSLSLPFLAATANNLVIAKTSLLQIFSFKSVVKDVSDHSSPVENHYSTPTTPWRRSERSSTTKLVLVGQYELSGTVTALARVKISSSLSGGEALLVGLRDAKMSLVQWDPERFTLSTISIHTYEREDLQSSPFMQDLHQYPSFLTVDPRSRCAALMFGARSIAVLPFHQADDDLMMDDNEAENDMNGGTDVVAEKTTNGDISNSQTPFQPSFVLSLLLLDPNLYFPVHLAFLHEYREPTFGILSSKIATSSALLHDRKDIISYTVYTMDLDQRASTTLLSIGGLPYDLHTVVPLPLPIGGSLLVGCNEIIHVDQSGKTNGIAVNEFAKMCSDFPLPHQAGLNLKLEGCVIEQLGTQNGEMLLVLGTGELAVIGFDRDGRTISGLSLQIVPTESGASLSAGCSCISGIGRGRLFMGSEVTDSIVMGWSKKGGKAKKRQSNGAMDVVHEDISADEDEEEELDDDDLYADSKPEPQVHAFRAEAAQGTSADEFTFRIHDKLLNLAPLSDIVVKHDGTADESTTVPSAVSLANIEAVVSSGQGQSSTLYEMYRKLKPSVRDSFGLGSVQKVWSLTAQRASGQTGNQLTPWNNVLITSRLTNSVSESSLYYLDDEDPKEILNTEFESTGATLEVLTINDGSHIVHVQNNDVKVYTSGKFSYCSSSFFRPWKEDIKSDGVAHIEALYTIQNELHRASNDSEVSGQSAPRSLCFCKYVLFEDDHSPDIKTRNNKSMNLVVTLSCLHLLLLSRLQCDVQMLTSPDFSLAQIFPLSDENEDNDLEVVKVSYAEPYILLILNDLNAKVLKVQESGELEEIDMPDSFKEQQWTSGSLFDDANDIFRLESEIEVEDEGGNVLLFLLSIEGGLKVILISARINTSKLISSLGVSPARLDLSSLCGRWT